MLMVSTEPFRK